jgi:hypothetical protein
VHCELDPSPTPRATTLLTTTVYPATTKSSLLIPTHQLAPNPKQTNPRSPTTGAPHPQNPRGLSRPQSANISLPNDCTSNSPPTAPESTPAELQHQCRPPSVPPSSSRKESPHDTPTPRMPSQTGFLPDNLRYSWRPRVPSSTRRHYSQIHTLPEMHLSASPVSPTQLHSLQLPAIDH